MAAFLVMAPLAAAFLVMAPLAAGLLLGVLFFVFPEIRENVAAGLSVIGIGAHDPWMESIDEYKPLLSGRDKNIFGSVLYYGWILWMMPILLAYMLVGLFKNGFMRDRQRMVFIAMSIAVLILTLLRRRFMHILAIDAAIVGGWLLYESYYLAARKFNRRRALALTGALCLILFNTFAYVAYKMPTMTIGYPIKGDIQDTMNWLRENTQAPRYPYDPLIKPPYSVMAPWDYAGWVEYIAERPVVATLYGTEAFGYEEAMVFYTTSDESQANAVMQRTGARYAIVSEPKTDLKKHDLGVSLLRVSARLHISDGMDMNAGAVAIKGVDHYRLVYESGGRVESLSWFPGDIRRLKIFEYVKGAALKVIASPGEKVSVSSRVLTNQGRVFDIKKEEWAGRRGDITFILPYAPLGEPGRTGLVLPYNVTAGERTVSVSITEADVLKGSVIDVQIPKKSL
jgi:asparagine N-glycosylation enzyme membrane subunit Stt3